LLKTQLLSGAMRLDPNAIRHQGAGQLLGRVIESSSVETALVTGGLASIVALFEIAFTIALLASGLGGAVHVVLYVLVVATAGLLAWRQLGHRRRWTAVRLSMTHDLVERMVGHRTRLAQEPRRHWHDGEDQGLARYHALSRDFDRTAVLVGILPRAWLFVGIACVVPHLLVGSPATEPLAVALGAVLLGHRALTSLTSSASQLAAAAVAWDEARPLVEAAANEPLAPPPSAAAATTETGAKPPAEGALLVQADDLGFRYRERGEPVLRGCSLRIHAGDRMLLEGPSGGGKSTLGAILTGLRVPDSGLLLLGGLDRHTHGDAGWRRRIVAAPQFHENHVFSNTFAFNLLMGRRWPPQRGDMEDAETVCRELGLGPLLDRMPAGLLQMVGETGWQLSHGEKSRLYLARALLQQADLVVLDESFAALDPETLRNAMECVRRRARTLLVIAHP
jgi:ATP-binding cassette subfamily B protein